LSPFTEALFEIKGDKVLLSHVMGKGQSPHRAPYLNLPPDTKELLEKNLHKIQKKLEESFTSKMFKGVDLLLLKTTRLSFFSI
jgi:hypothetical protein